MTRVKRRLAPFSILFVLNVLLGCGPGQDPEISSLAAARAPSSLDFDDFIVNGGSSKNTIWTNSYLLARLSEAAKHEFVRDRPGKLRDLALKEQAYIDGDQDTQVLIAYNKDLVLVAMPGTESGREVIQDLQIRKVEAWDLGLDVHNGFYRKANAIDEEVVKQLRKLKAVDDSTGHARKIWLAGHSQGGAALQILSMRLLQKGFRATGLVTFGSPKPGTDRFRVAYDSEYAGTSHRWINEKDPVPSLPIRDAYEHVGRQHYIDRDDDKIIYDDRREREWSIIWQGLDHHEIAEYVRVLERYRP